MSIILENIKNRPNVIKKQQYRYLDYNDLAIGQIGVLLIDFLQDKVNSGLISEKNRNTLLKNLNLNKNIPNRILDNNLLKECLVNIESDVFEYSYLENNEIKISLVNPKEKLKYLYDIADSIKLFYNKTDDKKIYPDVLAKEIFSIYELLPKSIDELLNFDHFNSFKDDFAPDFIEYIEDNIIFTTINSESPKYDINPIKLNSENYTININELKNLAPILINGNSIIWNKKEEVSMTDTILNINNVDLDSSIKHIFDSSSFSAEDKKSIKTYTFQYINDKIDLDKKVNNVSIDSKIFILKSLLEIDSLGEFLLNNNKANSYKNSIYGEFIKLNKILSIDPTDADNKISAIYNNINSIMNKFRNENTSINISINSKNEKKSFSFESNYYQIKAILKAYSKQSGLSMLLPGPPDFGKSHSVEELIDLFGGLIIKQEHILSLSALVGTFEKRSANFDPSKRTHPITELKTSVINGEYGNGIIHMEEGARTFMELLTSKVNSPDESALLSILEPMSRPNKFWKLDAYGQSIKLYPAEHIKFVWSTNFIPKNLSNELQVRFTSIPMDFSTITNFKSLKSITNNMLYKVNVDREINNFANEDNSIKFINIIQSVNSLTKNILNEYKLNNIYDIYKNSSDFKDYNSKLTKEDQTNIINFKLDNRIDPFILFILKDEISKLHSNIKEYIDIINDNDIKHLNDAMKYTRLKYMVENLNKDYEINIDFNQAFKTYGLNIDLVTKSLDQFGINNVNDILQRYHTIDAYFMTIINQFNYLNDIKIELLNSKSIVNNYSDLLLTVGDYIKDKIDINFITNPIYNDYNKSEIYQFLNIKDNYLKLATNYNSMIASDYKKIVENYNNKFAITPFKSSDAPIIGFEKIFKSINELSKSKGIINEEIFKTMTSGIDLDKFNSLLENNSVFVKSYNEDIGLGGINK